MAKELEFVCVAGNADRCSGGRFCRHVDVGGGLTARRSGQRRGVVIARERCQVCNFVPNSTFMSNQVDGIQPRSIGRV
jgi:hypothetical protein